MATAAGRAATVLAMAFCLAFSSGCAQRHLESASQSLEKEDYESAVTSLELGAQKGDRRCAYLLGAMLISGESIDADLAEGERWIREAAEAELPIAQAYLGILYANGEGVEKDLTTAAEWYRRAAEYGNSLGQTAFGVATFHGMGVPADPMEGYSWTKLAADQGYPRAIANLSEMSNELTKKEREQAEKRAARFHPKENEGSDPDFPGNREYRPFTNVRGLAPSFRGAAKHSVPPPQR
ncbi:MAG: sel1 repeat family protein [Deltaproteobacteria bacterium]|nr:sel1 repeat family protein [Deltaproteobacteria bacterium]MBW2694104.1 sel1 repeat family protein [Deltaproteobacteria bacterium]